MARKTSALRALVERCGVCRFLCNRNALTGRGMCRRFPSAVVVGDEEWCGEFRRQTKPPKEQG